MQAPLYLLGDVGGTHTRLCCLDENGDFNQSQVFDNRDFEGLVALIQTYLASLDPACRPRYAALAVAAPVSDDNIALTNLDWRFSRPGLQETLGFEQVTLLNDFEALALSIPDLATDDCPVLWPGTPRPGQPLAVLGPGTGLGVASLLPHQEDWLAIAGEGGHVTLAAVTSREAEIIACLREQLGHVSAECLLCGPGLLRLYASLAELAQDAVVLPESPEELTRTALDGTDPRARETLAIFFAMLGTVAGNLALTVGARGGVYLAGGILPGLRGALQKSEFHSRFVHKGRYHDYLSAIPIHLVTARYPAFTGLRRLVRRAAR